ncbi:MAG TPA: hypothetical protein VK427_05430 [Kofleriaceae bacterium]|nr:hypothetical protein [Kofleriaceae bacterium]
MARRRPPTDELKTAIFDPAAGNVEIATPTALDPPRERSEPIRVISMKTPPHVDDVRAPHAARTHKAKIRPLSDVVGAGQTPPHGMGYLAPPADPKERQARRLRDWLIWGSVLVMISCMVMLGVWFLAAR